VQWRTRAWIWYRIKGVTRRCVNAVRRLRCWKREVLTN